MPIIGGKCPSYVYTSAMQIYFVGVQMINGLQSYIIQSTIMAHYG